VGAARKQAGQHARAGCESRSSTELTTTDSLLTRHVFPPSLALSDAVSVATYRKRPRLRNWLVSQTNGTLA
jgi:hypothetical protein